jgi:hypothetical protein
MKKGTGWPSGHYGWHCQLLSEHHQASFLCYRMRYNFDMQRKVIFCLEITENIIHFTKFCGAISLNPPGSDSNTIKDRASIGVQEIMRL